MKHIKISTRFPIFILASLLVSSVFAILLTSSSAYAANLNKICEFNLSSSGKSISVSCDDDPSNGTIDGATYSGSGARLSNTQSGESEIRCRESISRGRVCEPTSDSKTLRCESFLSLSRNKSSAVISGTYLAVERDGNTTTKRCATLKSDSTSGGRTSVVRINNDNFKADTTSQAVLKFLGPKIQNYCERVAPTSRSSCVEARYQAVKDCVNFIGPTQNRQQKFTNCLKSNALLSFLSNKDAQQAANIYAGSLDDREKDTDDVIKDPSESGEDETSCNINGIGWVVCPLMVFMSELNDQAFEFIKDYLRVRPAIFTNAASNQAWQAFRDIANVLFVIAFLVIVYSQLSSAGISNYGVKKMLPKLVVAAILVNISYWVCAIAVDISNILGSSIYSLFDSIDVTKAGAKEPNAWDEAVAAILIVGAGIALLAAMAFVPAALLAFVLVIMILIARQAFVILLIVVAPIAFVAYLLPNTEDWFKKWYKAFTTVLMVYPIVAVVFGASALASRVLFNVAGEDEQLLAIVALGVLAIPLFAIPAILKGSLSAAGSIGQRISGMADKAQGRASKQAGERFGKRAERYKNRFNAANVNRAKRIAKSDNASLGGKNSVRRRLFMAGASLGASVAEDGEKKNEYAKIASDAAKRNYVGVRSDDDKYARNLAGGNEDMARLVQGYGAQAVREEEEKDIKAERSRIVNTDTAKLSEDIDKGKVTGERLAAYAAEVASRGSGEQVQATLDALARMSSASEEEQNVKRMAQQQLMNNLSTDQFGLSQGDKSALGTGSYEGAYDKKLDERAEKKMSGEKLASLQPHDVKALERLADSVIKNPNASDDERALSDNALQSLADSIVDARSNENVYSKLSTEAKKAHETILQAASARGKTGTTQQQSQSGPAATPQSQTPAPSAPSQSGPSIPGGESMTDSGLYVPRNSK